MDCGKQEWWEKQWLVGDGAWWEKQGIVGGVWNGGRSNGFWEI